jgi:hypothetical protein
VRITDALVRFVDGAGAAGTTPPHLCMGIVSVLLWCVIVPDGTLEDGRMLVVCPPPPPPGGVLCLILTVFWLARASGGARCGKYVLIIPPTLPFPPSLPSQHSRVRTTVHVAYGRPGKRQRQ